MRRFAALAPILLLVLACTLPPYNEDLSLAQMSAVDMDLVTTVGPFKFWPGDFEGRDVFFYPSKDALSQRFADGTTPLRGFVLVVGDYSVQLVFINYDTLNGNYYTNGDRGQYLDSSDAERFAYVAQTVKDGGSGLQIGGAFFAPEGGRRYFGLQYVEGTGQLVDTEIDLNAAGQAIGASFFPVDANTYDFFHLLRREPGLGTYAEESRNTSAGGLGAPVAIRSNLDLPGLPTEIESAFYFHNPTSALGRSYLSWYDPERRAYRNFWWEDPVPPQLHLMTHVERRIDLVLSNGWLFSRGENLGYLYDADGRYLNQFALGGLDLVYEIYLGPAPGVPHVVFTMEAWAPAGQHENPNLYFLVYILPTSKLADL